MEFRHWSAAILSAAAIAGPSTLEAQCPALDFDGIDDRVTVPYDESFPTEVFSASAWVNTIVNGDQMAIIARGEDDTSNNLVWKLYTGPNGEYRVQLEDAQEVNYIYQSRVNIAESRWRHVAATRSASGRLVLYVDAMPVLTVNNSGRPSSRNSQDLTIGCTHGYYGPPPGGVEPPTWFLDGGIDEPAMWNRVLSPAEILDVYLNGPDPKSEGLVGYWDLDAGGGQLIRDLSPVGNHGFRGDSMQADPSDPTWISYSRATYSTFGIGCAGSSGTPRLQAVAGSLPALGETFTVRVTNIPDGAEVLGIIGTHEAPTSVLELPIELGSVGMPGCLLNSQITNWTSIAANAGSATWSLPVPDRAGILGQSFTQQALVMDPGANPLGVTISNAGRAVVGCR